MRVEPFGDADAGRHRRGGHGVRAFSGRPARQRLTAERHGAGLRRGAPQQRMQACRRKQSKTDSQALRRVL